MRGQITAEATCQQEMKCRDCTRNSANATVYYVSTCSKVLNSKGYRGIQADVGVKYILCTYLFVFFSY